MIIHIENPKDNTKNLTGLVNELSNVAGYKINKQKSVELLYVNNDISETVIKKKISFTIASRRIKYLEISLTKETKDLYSENCKTLMKVIEDNTNKWKDIAYSWIGRINIVKMTILPKTIFQFI